MKTLPSRISPRRSDYDYTSSGAYFVTICTAGRQHYFWEIEDREMRLSDVGNICQQQIQHIEQSRSYVEIHESVVMPNHVHLLLILWTNNKPRLWYCRDDLVGRPNIENENGYINPELENGQATSLSLQINHDDYTWPLLWSIIGIFKSNVTKQIRKSWIEIPYWDQFKRQWRYHDHIIRNEKEYNAIKHYIQTNPQNRWEDKFYNW